MKIKPLGSRILVKLPDTDTETKSPGGIIILAKESQYEDRVKGLVVAIGPKVEEREMLNKEIFFEKYAGFTLEFEGVKYTMMFETDVLALA